MNGRDSSPPPAPYWEGHFKLSYVGDFKVFDGPGRLYYDPESHRFRLFDEHAEIRATVPMHRVRPLKSDKFPRLGNWYNVQLVHRAEHGPDLYCELHFKSPDEASRLNLHKLILEERGIEHPGASRQTYPPDSAMPAEQTPEAMHPVAEPPRASTPVEIEAVEQLVEQLRQKNADLEAKKAVCKQAEEEISRLKQENAKKDMAIVDLTMELLELKRSK